MYQLLRKFLFLFDAEKVHYFSMETLAFLCRIPPVKTILKNLFNPGEDSFQSQYFGLKFLNPVGLAAGFDKNAKYLKALNILGFGFVEIGTVTPVAQEGNPRPRLFRLPKDKAIINRMGFNNDGVKVVAERIRKFKANDPGLIIGGNIGKNKNTPNEDAWKDYEVCFAELHDTVDYFVVNVSSPNTPGLRELQHKEFLSKILKNLQQKNKTIKIKRPLLLKISPDLSRQELDDIIALSLEIKLDGLIVANTTITRNNLQTTQQKWENLTGGLSGKPLSEKCSEITNYIYLKTNGNLPIISSGGIFKMEDAEDKFNNGASLVQVWTGFIYEGPGIVKNICKGLSVRKIPE